MSRRSFLGAGAFTVLGAGGAGCDSGAGGDTTATEPLFALVPEDGTTRIHAATVSRFNKSSAKARAEATAELRDAPASSYDRVLGRALDGDRGPDLLFTWSAGAIRVSAEEHRLVDLYNLTEDYPEFGERLLPGVLEGCAVNHRPFGIPVRGTRPVVLFYHRALFADLGLQPPATWSDLKKAGARLRAANVVPVALAGSDPAAAARWLEYLVERIGGPGVADRVRSGDHGAWSDRTVLRAAQEVISMLDSGSFGDGVVGGEAATDSEAAALLAGGRAGLLLAESAQHAELARKFPVFTDKHLGWVPFPTVERGRGKPESLLGTPAGYLTMSERTENRLAAVALLKEFTGTAHSEALLRAGEVPATTTAAKLLDHAPNPEFARFQYEMVRKATNYTVSWERAVHPAWRDPMLTEVGDLFAGRSTAREFSEAMRRVELPVAR
ncbi:ABC transporter substrate-binding protein [Streptomyces sp. IB2014 016-6]|uniref:ABC transporter substrate-binding protein n=1 Tax=Streptomyces sp. IB2014 016-6 TaxID=2517818 RepID=UPI0011C8A4E4|nr:ABC transporter substrate-binding protein [Streptomyces sp. IB2014 016-6]TXL87581.1 carbohydrate ABC transporter substrate-binding protein [Streptomyces sp. IB2014 016-6]